ncbi:MAG TPA: hypothetical protein VN737_12060 [Bryobacteraceae bacterium]|nr:hypothetical protein [Bryobacteraceae bacterium]
MSVVEPSQPDEGQAWWVFEMLTIDPLPVAAQGSLVAQSKGRFMG